MVTSIFGIIIFVLFLTRRGVGTFRRAPDAPFRGLGLGFIGFGVLYLGLGFTALVLSLGVSF